ncbi:unnamed protein product [Caenorhabditis angaria]|uniref:Copper homeostasis protein cutC homolog n=1 Tax=Caenorhabditis angaria TaxID=860376 RepID=A0A9P1IHY0_9PELO|nr:unnamed protein product [Caenorhabditis angaria]
MFLEICIDNFESAINAVNGGCDRLEVCSSLQLGGLTPSVGFVSCLTLKVPETPLYCMIRPRAGNFVYSEDEMEANLEDVEWLKKAGAAGFVFGALTDSGELDRSACQSIIDAAKPLPVTLNRAIDVASDWRNTLEDAIQIGFKAVLTSGQEPTALDGVSVIQQMNEIAGDRIDILVGCGVNSSNVANLIEWTKCKMYHASASIIKDKKTNSVPMGKSDNQPLRITSVDEVRLLKTNMVP